jgi:DNA-binding response OmpR family regulator
MEKLASHPTTRILVLEDDFNIQKLLWVHLQREGWAADFFATADEVLTQFNKVRYDATILDWMVEGSKTGLDVCKELTGKIPILMLTSRSEPSDIVLGLEMGADDYLTKPFEGAVLIARLRALLRRVQVLKKANPTEFKVGSILLRADSAQVFSAGQPVELTATEFKILYHLLLEAGRVMTREKLLKKVQDAGISVTDRVIDTHVYHIRKKLGEAGQQIETIRGIGYRVKE